METDLLGAVGLWLHADGIAPSAASRAPAATTVRTLVPIAFPLLKRHAV
jgi:hypothetical protein